MLRLPLLFFFFFFNDTATTEIYTLSLHDALPIAQGERFEIPLDVVHGAVLLVRIAVEDAVAGGRYDRDVTVVEVDDRARVRQHRAGVRGDQVLAVTDPEQDRRAAPRHDDLSRLG